MQQQKSTNICNRGLFSLVPIAIHTDHYGAICNRSHLTYALTVVREGFTLPMHFNAVLLSHASGITLHSLAWRKPVHILGSWNSSAFVQQPVLWSLWRHRGHLLTPTCTPWLYPSWQRLSAGSADIAWKKINSRSEDDLRCSDEKWSGWLGTSLKDLRLIPPLQLWLDLLLELYTK